MEIACPYCQTKLRVSEEYQGKKVRCSKCKQIFVASVLPEGKTPTPEQPDDEFWSIVDQPEEGGSGWSVEKERGTTRINNSQDPTSDAHRGPPGQSQTGEKPSGKHEDFKVKCKKCGTRFAPRKPRSIEFKPKDQPSFIYWLCPKCNTKNPNLLRHCRHIAVLFIISAIITIIQINKTGVSSSTKVINYGILALQILAIFAIYGTRQPWRSFAVTSLVWIVVGSRLSLGAFQAFLTHTNIPVAQRFVYSIGTIALFGAYFFWVLHAGPKKYISS